MAYVTGHPFGRSYVPIAADFEKRDFIDKPSLVFAEAGIDALIVEASKHSL
jgi:hypothetical protein